MWSPDQHTAEAFARSWNSLPLGSVYTREQFADWVAPLGPSDFARRHVLELGCGNASLMMHMADWKPASLLGIDLGQSVQSAEANMAKTGFRNYEIKQTDLTTFRGPGHDLVVCIGVLHHLSEPETGFRSVIANVKAGGAFHCWVYAREGNDVVMQVVERLRRITSRFPWYVTKYSVAAPLAVPFQLYAKLLARLPAGLARSAGLPMREYCTWIAKSESKFFRHVVFDQLVSPQTTYITRDTIEQWLASDDRIEPGTTYIVMRNGNSWKFGGRVRA